MRMDGGVWSVYRGGEGTVRRGIFRQIFFGMDVEVGLMRLELGSILLGIWDRLGV